MRALSKSKLMAFRQCPRRLWLEVLHPELREDSSTTQASFVAGHSVGDAARRIYDPKNTGSMIDLKALGFPGAFVETSRLLPVGKPIFEASFTIPGAMAMADVLLPIGRGSSRRWRMIEVKSSTAIKDYHRDDAAIQSYVARKSGLPLARISVARIDSSWVYPGGDTYDGLLVEDDLTAETRAREKEVADWIAQSHALIGKRREPEISTGKHCSAPYECGFLGHCSSSEPVADYPVSWLPRRTKKALVDHIETKGVIDFRDVPDDLLNEKQLRVKKHTLAGKVFFDGPAAAASLRVHKLPAIFVDFETVNFAVPIWKGTRPYQQIPFQFSAHVLSRTGKLSCTGFLDLSGKDPSRSFAESLLATCGEHAPIFVYNASFERSVIKALAERFKALQRPLMALTERLVDLLPIAEANFYHPLQEGSWSIKAVLPAIAPDLNYADLDGVKDGSMASAAFIEAINPATDTARREGIRTELERYCELDTFAMVRLWQQFSGSDITLRRT